MSTDTTTDTTDTDSTATGQADTLSASARNGKILFEKHECLSCHTIDGDRQLGPPIKGLYGSERELEDGSTVIADEGYIKESIQYPSSKIAQGYNDNMPSFRDLLTEKELQEITDYFKALR